MNDSAVRARPIAKHSAATTANSTLPHARSFTSAPVNTMRQSRMSFVRTSSRSARVAAVFFCMKPSFQTKRLRYHKKVTIGEHEREGGGKERTGLI